MPSLDPVALAQALIRCPSITPVDAGALDVVASAAEAIGFSIHRLEFGGTPNIYARRGDSDPRICFAGHTDVVPPGEGRWSVGPFSGEIRDDVLLGRGACDMKGAIAAFLAAASHLDAEAGSVSLLITGDEEGPATGGTVQVLEWMAANRQIPDFCLVGEPTNPSVLGEVIKIGRRGSLNATINVFGTQGHVAYPNRIDNPVHRLVTALAEITAQPLDGGTDWFEPSGLQITSVDVGNASTNLVPASASARLNIRFNDRHTGATLQAWLNAIIRRHAKRYTLDITVSGEAFLTQPGEAVAQLARAVFDVTGVQPRFDTGGGTSDARFISRYCPVAEFGLVGSTMHMVDEQAPVADLLALAAVYRRMLQAFLA